MRRPIPATIESRKGARRKERGMRNIPVDDGSTTTSDHGPDTALSIEDSKLKRSTSATIEFLDIGLFLGEVTAPWGGPDYSVLKIHWRSARE